MYLFNKVFSFMLKPWVVISILSLVVISFFYIDKNLALYIHSLHLGEGVLVLSIITTMGISGIYLAILPILAIVLYLFHKKTWSLRVCMLWCLVFFPTLITYVLKNFLGRARPIALFNNDLFGFFGYTRAENFHSFPSGHTTTITGLMLGLLILFPRYCYLFLLIGFSVMFSRVFLTWHYLSDVLMTFYLVTLEVGLLVYITKRKFPNMSELIFNGKVS